LDVLTNSAIVLVPILSSETISEGIFISIDPVELSDKGNETFVLGGGIKLLILNYPLGYCHDIGGCFGLGIATDYGTLVAN